MVYDKYQTVSKYYKTRIFRVPFISQPYRRREYLKSHAIFKFFLVF